MALYTIEHLRTTGAAAMKQRTVSEIAAVDNAIDQERIKKTGFDLYVSQSGADKYLIYGLYLEFKEKFDLLPYVDWIHDHDINKSDITAATAETLRNRIKQSKCFVYVCTEDASHSVWMPWELGFIDATGKTKIALLLLRNNSNKEFGSGYKNLYPYIDLGHDKNFHETLWLNGDEGKYVSFVEWLNGKQPYIHEVKPK
jgi:hypothetical protein